ncbi:biotin carboxylase [Nocardioides albidus]|uniref:Biotin carboxylase n=1 Tax=Nocardioides albidus TaxID=1517589 RepID=A0A5C4WKZ6_9ACTN|nr:biotin carboxylase [Nocardioides albidus]TNM48256.1 biotin carboxylase [Nocardioides albidus]
MSTPPSRRPAAKATAKKATAKKTTAKKTSAKKAPAPRTTKKAAPEPVTPEPVEEYHEPPGTEPVPTLGTDAAFAPAAPPVPRRRTLRNMSEVRHFFRTNDVPVYFIGATPFNLLGLDRWVRNFTYVTYYDAWDGAHPRVFTPTNKPYVEFESGEDINNWLLCNAEVRAFIAARQAQTGTGERPKIAMVFFDEETERICDELGYDLILPSAELRTRLDSKLVTTRLGNEVGVPSVPNVMASVDSWDQLVAAAEDAGLGTDLVVQTAYGDSGKTTFFIASEADWTAHADDIVGEEVKVMKRIDNRPVAVEAVLTSCGTVVGPFMSELTGHRKLTPYRGGWCGNEMYPEVLTGELRARAADLVRRLGDRLGQEGYRGFFEVDVLVDVDTDEVYLGELNPRISGASAITNVTAGAYADVPLFLFHLLEYLDVEIDLDVDEINERWQELAAVDLWSQMIIKETSPVVELIGTAAPTGQYTLDASGALVFRRAALDWHQLQNESEAFFLRIYGPGDYRWKGADLGVLVTKGRLQTGRPGEPAGLTIRARHLIDSIRAQYSGTPMMPPAGSAGPGETDLTSVGSVGKG